MTEVFRARQESASTREAYEEARNVNIIYARLQALLGTFICVYVVDPETGDYHEFSATEEYTEDLKQAKEGTDFFGTVRQAARQFNYPDDLKRFLSAFTRENIMAEIERSGIFTLGYRLMMEGRPVHVRMNAVMVEEKEGLRLIVGLNDVDMQVRQEEGDGECLICHGTGKVVGEPYVYGEATVPVLAKHLKVVATVSVDGGSETSGLSLDYDGKPHRIMVNATYPASGASVRYGIAAGTYDLTESPTNTNAGNYTVYYKVTASGYEDLIGSATMTIREADIPSDAIVAPTVRTLTYTGQSQELVTAGKVTTGGTMQYVLGTATEATEPYTTSIPSKTDAGTYYVWYKAVGDSNHNDSSSSCVEVKINPVDKTKLNQAIQTAETYYNSIKDKEEYKDITENLEKTIEDAKEIADNDNVTEDVVKNATSTISQTVETAKTDMADTDAALLVINKINALPSPDALKTSDEDDIVAAREAYEELTPAQQAKLKNIQKLDSAEVVLAALKRAEQAEVDKVAAEKAAEEAEKAKEDAITAKEEAQKKEKEAKEAEEAAIKTKEDAEAAATAAEDAKTKAEEERDAALKAKDDAEKAQAEAEQAAADAKKAQEEAEAKAAAAAQAQADKTAAQNAQKAAETARSFAEARATAANNARAAAEAARKIAEEAAKAAEEAKAKAEADKDAAEERQAAAEKAQKEAEEKAKAAEKEKAEAEAAKAKAEADKKAAGDKAKEAQNNILAPLAKTKNVKVKGGKRKATVRWKAVDGAKGYEIIISRNKRGTKKVKTVKAKGIKKVIKKLKKGKYFIKVRAWKKYKGNTVCGKYSKVKKVKVK